MNMKAKSIKTWDVEFFSEFIEIRNDIYRNHPDFIPETIKEYAIFFEASSFFAMYVDWLAVIVPNHGRYMLCQKPNSVSLSLGYFECFGSEEVVRECLFRDIQTFTEKHPKLVSVKGPIQGSLFAGYRFREASSEPRFLGEALHLDTYPILWKKWGFQIEEYWDSFKFDLPAGIDFYRSYETKLGKFWQDPKIKMRPLQRKNWDLELKQIFEITMEAYDIEETNDAIDFKIFKFISENLKHLARPNLIQLLIYDKNVMGFTISYPDIQEEIRRFNRRKRYCPLFFNKLLLICDVKFRKHPLMMVYVAKRKSCPIKWAMAKMGNAVAQTLSAGDFLYVISVLNAESSGSRASLPKSKKLHSRHFLMKLPLVESGPQS